jgi:ribonuclease-3
MKINEYAGHVSEHLSTKHVVMSKTAAIQKLYQKLGYTFHQQTLLEDALSHRSYRGQNNERMEFLGDAILNFVISAYLFHTWPDAREGELSRLRANLVRGDTLAIVAQELDLGAHIRLGAGELKSGGSRRTSILADAMEAVVAAIFLDGGLPACEQCILRWFASRLQNFTEVPSLKDAKTRLQEFLQAKHFPLPNYSILSIDGAAHQQIFSIECRIDGFPHMAIGIGSSRRRAEQDAAQKILDQLENSA